MSWNFPGAGGGGGSGLPAGYEVEVAAAGDLATALAANDSVYVSGNITISAKITISGNKRILFADGITVTGLDALAGDDCFEIPTGTKLSIDCPGSYTIVSEVSHTGDIFHSTGTGHIYGTGQCLYDGSLAANLRFCSDLQGYIDHLEITMFDGANTLDGDNSPAAPQLRIGYALLKGAGTQCRLATSNVHWGKLYLTGPFKTLNTATPNTTSALDLNAGTIDFLSCTADAAIGIEMVRKAFIGHVFAAESSNFDIHLITGQDCHVMQCGSERIFIAPRDGTHGNNNVIGPGSFRGFTKSSSADCLTLMAPGFAVASTLDDLDQSRMIGGASPAAVTLGATFIQNEIVGHRFSTLSFTSGAANNRFTGCLMVAAMSLPSGTFSVFVNCRFDGTVTIDSGAKCVFIGCTAATITNNDGLNSKISGCITAAGLHHHANNDGRIVYDSTATTDATQTELLRDGTARFTLPADTTAIVNIKILAQRDNQDWASFQYLNCILAEDSGYTVTNGTASAGPDHSKGTGSSLVIALDAFSGLRIQGTGNAAENWKWQTEIEFVTATN